MEYENKMYACGNRLADEPVDVTSVRGRAKCSQACPKPKRGATWGLAGSVPSTSTSTSGHPQPYVSVTRSSCIQGLF